MKNKRGMSEVIATLLIILLVLVAMGVVWIIIQNIILSGSDDVSLDRFLVDLDIQEASVNSGTSEILVNIKRKPGEGNLVGIKFVFYSDEGSESFEEDVLLQELEEENFNFILINLDVSDVVNVSVAPIFETEAKKRRIWGFVDSYDIGEGIFVPGSALVSLNQVLPLEDILVSKNEFFDVITEVCCSEDDCGEVEVSLDPSADPPLIHVSWLYEIYMASDRVMYCDNMGGDWGCDQLYAANTLKGYNSIFANTPESIHISYGGSYGDLNYYKKSGETWSSSTLDYTNYRIVNDQSLVVDDNGVSYISHDDNSELLFSTNLNGSWVTSQKIDSGFAKGGKWSSIALDGNNKIHISHSNDTDLRYCKNTIGSWDCETIEESGGYTSLALDSNSHPRISHYDLVNESLRYCNELGGDWDCETVEDKAEVQPYLDVVYNDGIEKDILLGSEDILADVEYEDYNMNLGSQIKFDTSSISSGATINSAEMCFYINSMQGSFANIDVWRITDQIWDESILAIELNGQSKSNLTTVGLSSILVNTWGCFDVLPQLQSSVNSLEQSFSIRFEGENNNLGTISFVYGIGNSIMVGGNWRRDYLSFDSREAGTDIGKWTSMALDSNNKAHISYQDSSGNNLRYCTDKDGYWDCMGVEVGGLYSEIAIDSNDIPHIVHRSSYSIRYCNKSGGDWGCEDIGVVGYASDSKPAPSLFIEGMTGRSNVVFEEVPSTQKAGLIPEGFGVPFYTTSQNPQMINLNEGDCQEITWSVDPTGYGLYDFFVFADGSEVDYAETNHWDVEVV